MIHTARGHWTSSGPAGRSWGSGPKLPVCRPLLPSRQPRTPDLARSLRVSDSGLSRSCLAACSLYIIHLKVGGGRGGGLNTERLTPSPDTTDTPVRVLATSCPCQVVTSGIIKTTSDDTSVSSPAYFIVKQHHIGTLWIPDSQKHLESGHLVLRNQSRR